MVLPSELPPASQLFQRVAKSSTIFRNIFIILCLILLSSNCRAEYFSSTDSIQQLVLAEEELIQWFQQFLSTQANDFELFRKFIAKVKEEHALALEDPQSYLGNPLNAFKLIKRTVVDWNQLTEYVKNHPRLQALKTNLTELETEFKMPDSNELRGAAKGLGRLQTMYNLNSADLANGIINDIYYGSQLSTRECFEIGASLFEAKEYPLAISWSKLVLKSLEKEADINTKENKILAEHEEDAASSQKHNDYVGKINIFNDQNDNQDEQCEGEINEVPGDWIGDEKDVVEEEHENNFKEEDNVDTENDLDEEKYIDINPVAVYELDDEEISEQDKIPKISSIKANCKHKPVSPKKENELPFQREAQPIAFDDKQSAQKMYVDTLEYLALAEYELGRREDATGYIGRIIQLDPENALKDLEPYMSAREVPNLQNIDNLSELQKKEWFSNYSRLCQGSRLHKKNVQKLHCKLDTLNHPLFILAPLQKEELHSDPDIAIYYGLLNDAQIDDILEMSDKDMRRSEVGGETIGAVRDVRVSQQTWLSYKDPTTKYIYRTVSAISGFDLRNAEVMQVANYGVGGQYDPHFDYFGKSPEQNEDLTWIGDRISTNLFYISDVDQGGYTVFPILDVYLKPVKGAMVLWHNLHKSLDPDPRTMHAGCPVIKGTKRICNVWVHSGYQEFRRPCELTRDNYKSEPWRYVTF